MRTFDALLSECGKLKIDDLDIFIDILKNRAREKRRAAIAARGRRAVANSKAGKCCEGIDELMQAVENA